MKSQRFNEMPTTKTKSRSVSRHTQKRIVNINQSFIDKHIMRMEQARINLEYKKVSEDLKPGSGKIWKNELTKPMVPNITGLLITG